MKKSRFSATLRMSTSLVLLIYSNHLNAQGNIDSKTISDIAFVYHGTALDSNFNVIQLDFVSIEQIQDSIFDVLGAPRQTAASPDGDLGPNRAPLLPLASRRQLLAQFSDHSPARVVAKQTLIEQAIAHLPGNERNLYRSRVAVISQAINQLPEIQKARADQTLQTLMENAKKLIFMPVGPLPQAAKSYIDECTANSVPIPPNWPDTKWMSRGELKLTFASFPNATITEVFTYEAPAGQGLCYALPRKNANGGFEAVGMICQSKETGKACFWDNIDAVTGTRITGQNISLEIPKIQNGFVLEENCTECHRGGNVFMIHPKTPLGAVAGRNPKVRYTPIGQSTWSNPPALAEVGDGACSECHEIAAANTAYCGFLAKASDITMPTPDAVAGWTSPKAEYRAHIDFLKTNCR